MTEVAHQLGRLAEAIETHNDRDTIADREADYRAIRDLPRVTTSLRRGLAVVVARAIPWEKTVPPSHVQRDDDAAVVSCLCGAELRVELALPVACAGADCSRFFLFDGTNVRVARPQPEA